MATVEAEVLPPSTDIMVAVEASPQIVLLDPKKFDQFYERVKAETETLVVDLSTKTGRDKVRSMAAKVTRTKTMIDKARLQLTAQWREQTKQVNSAGSEIEARLIALADDVRRPLTEWEEAEDARVEKCRAAISGFKTAAVVMIEDTAATVRARGKEVWEQAIDPEQFGDMLDEAVAAKDTAVVALKAALARLTKEEADRAELEKLRAEKEEQEAREAEHQQRLAHAKNLIEHCKGCANGFIGPHPYPYVLLIRELEDKLPPEIAELGDYGADVELARVQALEKVKAVKAEGDKRRREEAERAEQERIATAAREAEERARQEAERKAEAKREEERRQHEEELAAERRRAAEAEAAAQAERDRATQAEADRLAEEQRIADEKAEREANQQHRASLKTAAKEAIIALGIPEAKAVKVVQAIVAGDIPNVRMEF